MCEFVAIGLETERIEEEDTEAAIAFVQQGRGVTVPRLERAQMLLEHGAGYDVREGDRERNMGGRRSADGRAVAFVNRVNALALGMTENELTQSPPTWKYPVVFLFNFTYTMEHHVPTTKTWSAVAIA